MKKYAVASSHPLSTIAGEEALSKGGNAYDALLATSAALTVVQPHLNGLGGDFFATVKDGNYYCINASGYAAALADIEFFRSRGYSKIPERGIYSSFSIPGLVSAWKLIEKKANLTLKENFSRAIGYAKNGFKKSNKLKKAIDSFTHGDSDFNSIYKKSGDILYQKDLGKTLETLANDGLDSFYHGDIARKINDDMVSKGGLIRFNDLDNFSPEIREPLTVKYRDFKIYTNPPVSQGLTEIVWFNQLNNYELNSMNKEDYYDTLIKTMMDSYKYRPEYIYDGSVIDDSIFSNVPKTNFNGKDNHLSDTTAFSIFDGEIEISAIQSNFMGFGSGHTIHGTGINMNNRGSYFTLDANHKNALKPHKKTFHTLMSTIATGKFDIIFGSMGGDVQPQINVQVLSRIIDLNYNIQDAISHPRFAYPASIYNNADIFYEKSLNLKKYKMVNDLNDMMGHAQGILYDGNVHTGFDPRGDAFEII